MSLPGPQGLLCILRFHTHLSYHIPWLCVAFLEQKFKFYFLASALAVLCLAYALPTSPHEGPD